MAERVDRRADRRFRVELMTQVSAKSMDGETFKDKTLLRNMSGSGASFSTRQAERYFQGQRVDLQIELPGTTDLKACLRGPAMVSRIETLADADPQPGARPYGVAVVIPAPLQFYRITPGPQAVDLAGAAE